MTFTVAIERRRELMRAQNVLNGIDYVEVAPDRQTLAIVFFKQPPAALVEAEQPPLTVIGEDGDTLPVTGVTLFEPEDPTIESAARIDLARAGRAGTTYRVALVDVPDIDPLFAYATVRMPLAPGQQGQADCAAKAVAGTIAPASPPFNYLAKDYQGFRQLILDRLAITLPQWTERHVTDAGIMLAEVMAFAADRLSYFQDAVATEAYLGTARRRISIRRHARLVDYAMHEGCNARAFVQITPPQDITLDAATIAVTPAAATGQNDPATLPLFAPMLAGQVPLRVAHDSIRFHDWGDEGCVLSQGSTRATLRDIWAEPDRDDPGDDDPERARRLALAAGDFLLFEQVRNPVDGDAETADPHIRHVVRLTEVRTGYDALLKHPTVEIAWGAEDALPFPLVLSTVDRNGRTVPTISVARGNMLLLDHGRPVARDHVKAGRDTGGARTVTLPDRDIVFAAAIADGASAAACLTQDPRGALPAITAVASRSGTAPHELDWTARADLLASAADSRDYVVEVDDERVAHLRFGSGTMGRDPGAVSFSLAYRVGARQDGLIAADRLTRLLLNGEVADGYVVRNPLASAASSPPESVAQVRALAPHAFATALRRAVTADDYAVLAEEHPQVQRATCAFTVVGTRTIATVAIDSVGGEQADPALLAGVGDLLEQYRTIGHDVDVVQGSYVPLLLELRATVADGYLQAHVAAAIRAALGTGVLPDGSLAFFHPDRFSFGTAIHESAIIAAAAGVAGVQSVSISWFGRLFDPTVDDVREGALRLGVFELAQLDGDPARPERGRLALSLTGGR